MISENATNQRLGSGRQDEPNDVKGYETFPELGRGTDRRSSLFSMLQAIRRGGNAVS